MLVSLLTSIFGCRYSLIQGFRAEHEGGIAGLHYLKPFTSPLLRPLGMGSSDALHVGIAKTEGWASRADRAHYVVRRADLSKLSIDSW